MYSIGVLRNANASEIDETTMNWGAPCEVRFRQVQPDVYNAGIALREAVGNVHRLRDSMVGLKPKCFMGCLQVHFDRKVHEQMRRFKTEEELEAFEAYLEDLLAKMRTVLGGDKQPRYEKLLEGGFVYETASGMAMVRLEKIVNGGGGLSAASAACRARR